jgi:predicted dehydrogenase
MRRIVIAAAALITGVTGTAAQQRYDGALEKAAAAIVAGKIGEIRGGFAYDRLPEFVRPVDWRRAAWNIEPDQQPKVPAAEARSR